MSDFLSREPPLDEPPVHPQLGAPAAVYDYVDERGEPLFVVCRFEPKDFRQAHLVDGRWTWSMNGVRRVLYRLPHIQQAVAAGETIYVAEGEKDVGAIEAAGGVATCNPMGAGKWSDELAEQLQSARRVVIVADNDEPGQRHAHEVAASLARVGIVAEIVQAAEGKDAADHLAAGFALEDLEPAQVAPPEAARASAQSIAIVSLEKFAEGEEDSAEPLLGERDETVLAAGSTLLMYGDGGTSKTTLSIDAMAHAAAGISWLGVKVSRSLRVLLVENEGPRGPFRAKLARKLGSWTGPPFADNIFVLEEPWASFSFANASHRTQLATLVLEHSIDVLVANPLATLGVAGGGTPDDVRAFDAHLADFRRLVARPIALWLVHHENKAGDVSGAFERMPDTLVHVRLDGRERSRVHWRKVRWSSQLHNRSWTLRWLPEREGFELVDAEEETAVKRASELADATAWILDYVTAQPGLARSKVEQAYHDAHKGGRNLARRAIDEQLRQLEEHNAGGERVPCLATTTGETPHGTYLIPFSEAVSPLAAPLFGESGETSLNPEAGTPLAVSPPTPKGWREKSGERADGVDEDEVERLAEIAEQTAEEAHR